MSAAGDAERSDFAFACAEHGRRWIDDAAIDEERVERLKTGNVPCPSEAGTLE